MTGGIGWYVHHQGAGHLQRARAVAAHLSRPCTIIGTLAGFETGGAPILDLPDDRPLDGASAFAGLDGEAARPEAFHYAPLRHPGLRRRMALIADWVARTDPALLVVDVSVEVALFARLLSVPTVVVRLAGDRTDRPHCEAFRSASRLLAPFPAELDGPDVPGWVRSKTFHAGFLGGGPPATTQDGQDIVVVFGRGGEGGDLPAIAAAARAVPGRQWHVLGPVSGEGDRPENLHLHGWVSDVGAFVGRAALLVGGAGDGLVALAASHGKRFLCLPEPRAYGEQTVKANALSHLGAAVVRPAFPAAEEWPALVAETLALDPAIMSGLHDVGGLARCAAFLDGLAGDGR
ncbi:glycosyltransferase [Methylobacterium sp. J-076]|uniref:glycosyltransferase n=1 Tax=Methylobacterium sp. J-076 TaxID=2836655 RepID=UPI001FB9F2A8|nr:glycosyltransferase [Methylobacterium sp. J-076]MCJ2014011.1 glycosyltransferase [Methylobacterium sp. J-076]